MHTALIFGKNMSEGLDTLSNAMFEPVNKMNVMELYRLDASYLRLVGAAFSDRTSSQLKAGGMRYIKKAPVANAIAAYWSGIKNVEGPQENYRNRLIAAADISYTIFNGKYSQNLGIDSLTHLSHVKIDSAAKFMITDEAKFVNYANRIRTMRNMLRNFYLYNLEKQYNTCLSLMTLIKKEYLID
jgi:hypothetical protein